MQGLVVDRDIFLRCDRLEVPYYVGDADAVEVEGLATRKDRRKDLMLFSRCKYEYCVCRRLFECLQEGVESSRREHMDLVDYVHAVLSDLRRDLYLVHKVLDVVHSVVGRGVKLVDTVRAAFLERDAGLAFATRLHILRRIGTVDGFCEYPGGRCLAHSAGTAEKVRMRQFPPDDRILQGLCDIVLPDKRLE